ncbi:MAG TPA: polysaccharide biosynthesis/export family protein [Kofleriaceae bacterium]|jgi:polysaccharide export outer membrane protein|nr:polysaccharide biosynthesis/export family protein [Kofleriaceae bacterium]
MRTALLLITLLMGCGAAVPPPGGIPKFWLVDPRNQPVVLGAGDTLAISVWNQKDLDTETVVRPDGTITMRLVGDIKAAGQTPAAVHDTITKALQNFVKIASPNEVTVNVKSYMSYRFTVQGEVGKPGQFSSPSYVSVSDAVALAGGPTRFAKRDSMVLFRKDSKGETQSLNISYDLIASGKRPDLNVWILPDDVLYMP